MRRGLAGVLAGLVLMGAGAGCGGNQGTGPTGSGGSPSGGAPGSGGASGGVSGSGGAASGGVVGGGGSGGTASGGGAATGGRSDPGSGGAGNGGNGTSGGGTTASGGASAGAPGGGGRGGGGGGAATGGAGGAGSLHWVGTWTGAPQLTETANLPPASLTGSVLRQIVRVSLGGSQIRVRFSNEFGNGPLTITAAHVAVCKANPVDSTIDTATDKALGFGGMAGTTLAQGKSVWSDPLDFTLPPLGNLTVTTVFGTVPSDVTGHPGSRTTSYLQTASTTLNAANMASAQKVDHWYVLSGVDVMADASARGLVILGDSITDGKGSTTNANNRWPDLLAKRLQANTPTAKVAVMNQGIGGNNVTADGLGPPASMRYMRDLLGQSGVRWVIVYEGVNDVGTDIAAGPVIAVFDQIISQAHAQGLLVYGATITPFATHSYYTAPRETQRQSVNSYLRGTKFDGTIDFDAAVRDASTPPRLQSSYDSGDGLHLTPAGYQKMADTVDLTLFTR